MRGTRRAGRRRSSSNSTHLVAKTLGGDNGDLVAYSLVGLKVEGEFGVVSFDDDFGGLLDSLCLDQSSFLQNLEVIQG